MRLDGLYEHNRGKHVNPVYVLVVRLGDIREIFYELHAGVINEHIHMRAKGSNGLSDNCLRKVRVMEIRLDADALERVS